MAIIEINNLGPVKNCKMNLEQFCVLTGPQASGKSIIAKALFYFRKGLQEKKWKSCWHGFFQNVIK